MINITKPFLPPQEEYNEMIKGIWDRAWLTNNGPLVQKLESKLKLYLDVPTMHFVTNGTMALQLAIKALDLNGEIITTPFSFAATTTAIVWEKCEPVFVDIRPDTLCIDAEKIEESITEKTSAILATHVYGIPCDVEKIDRISKKYNLKVIYDAAHAFGVKYKGKSILSYGDISTLSFHATKVFHTIEGGGIVNNTGSIQLDENLNKIKNFGLQAGIPVMEGINAKNSEFHAAMGLCNLKYIEVNFNKRKKISEVYSNSLHQSVQLINDCFEIDYNYAYYPIILNNEEMLFKVMHLLEVQGVKSRRYFYPSLNELPYLDLSNHCKISEDISKRILCLPLYSDLSLKDVEKISNIVNITIER